MTSTTILLNKPIYIDSKGQVGENDYHLHFRSGTSYVNLSNISKQNLITLRDAIDGLLANQPARVMFCPLLKRQCIEDGCGWWDTAICQCAPLALIAQLEDATTAITSLRV